MPADKPTFEEWMKKKGFRPGAQPDKDFTNYDGVYEQYKEEVFGTGETTLKKVRRVLGKLFHSGE